MATTAATAAVYHHIPATDIGLTFNEGHEEYMNAAGNPVEDEGIAALLTEHMHAKSIAAKRGDVVGLHPNTFDDRYRNDGVFLYDGEKVTTLDSDIDQYGALPPSIQVTDTEFAPHYWQDVMHHNQIFWLAQPILDRMRVFWNPDLRLHVGAVNICRRPYFFVVAPANDEEMQDALDGKPVEPSETAEQIMEDLRAGKYYFELNHGDLDCIDHDVKPERLFYAIRRPADE
jgi:hypothetical protein